MTSAPLPGATTTTSQQQQHDSMKKESKATFWFLRFCALLTWATLVANGLGVLCNIVLVLIDQEDNANAVVFDLLLRMYSCLLCTLCAFAELELCGKFLSSYFGYMDTWVGKGLASVFNAVLVFTFNLKQQEGKWQSVLQSVTGNALLAVGTVYLVCGIACLNRIKESHMNKLRKRDQVRREKAELESRKHEIEALLRDTESQLEKI